MHPTHRVVFPEQFQRYATLEGFGFQHELETLVERVEGEELVWEGLTVILLYKVNVNYKPADFITKQQTSHIANHM